MQLLWTDVLITLYMLPFIPLHFLCTHFWQLVHCIELLPTSWNLASLGFSLNAPCLSRCALHPVNIYRTARSVQITPTARCATDRQRLVGCASVPAIMTLRWRRRPWSYYDVAVVPRQQTCGRSFYKVIIFFPTMTPINMRPSIDLAHDGTCLHAKFHQRMLRRFWGDR